MKQSKHEKKELIAQYKSSIIMAVRRKWNSSTGEIHVVIPRWGYTLSMPIKREIPKEEEQKHVGSFLHHTIVVCLSILL